MNLRQPDFSAFFLLLQAGEKTAAFRFGKGLDYVLQHPPHKRNRKSVQLGDGPAFIFTVRVFYVAPVSLGAGIAFVIAVASGVAGAAPAADQQS